MKRAALALGAAFALVACAGLFGDATQCSSDAECTKFGPAVTCSEGVCKSRTGATDGPNDVGVDGPPIDSPPEATPEMKCMSTSKESVRIDGEPFDPGDGVMSLAITKSVTLDCTRDWVVPSRLFVRPPAVLTIQPRTTVRLGREGAVIVLPGGRIIADGKADQPIVFTSTELPPVAGGYRGIYVFGVAPRSGTNPFDDDLTLPFGGTNPEDDSGILRYVRVEYGAYGLVLAGVGRRTTVDFVQARKVSRSCFTFAGGSVDTKHLVCQSPGADFFEYRAGYTGRGQFLFGQDVAPGAHAGLSANDATPVVYNATMCGKSPANDAVGLSLQNTRIDLANAIVTGFGVGVDAINAVGSPFEVRSSILANNTVNPAYDETDTEDTSSPLYDDDLGFDEIAWFGDGTRANTTTNPELAACFDVNAPNPAPKSTITTNVRIPPTDGFFDVNATYIGAFKDAGDAWMKGAWLRFAGQ